LITTTIAATSVAGGDGRSYGGQIVDDVKTLIGRFLFDSIDSTDPTATPQTDAFAASAAAARSISVSAAIVTIDVTGEDISFVATGNPQIHSTPTARDKVFELLAEHNGKISEAQERLSRTRRNRQFPLPVAPHKSKADIRSLALLDQLFAAELSDEPWDWKKQASRGDFDEWVDEPHFAHRGRSSTRFGT
jgi:hypothetical protein